MNAREEGSSAPHTGQPTGKRDSVARIAGRAAGYGGVLIAAVAGVYFMTRDAAAPPDATGAHSHAAMGAGSDEPQPVSLTLDQARRIGVTYAVATVGAFGKEVRTVGQIALDETRMHAVSPKIDGWIERLYVNATGQPVRAGEPLFTIYSPMLVQAQEELLLAAKLEGELAGASGDAQGGAATLRESARRRLAYWDIPAREIDEIERRGEVRKELTISSPVSGYVMQKDVVAGQKIMAGETIYRIADLREVWVEGEVFEQDLAAVRVGQTVHADLPAMPGEHRMGKISFVYPTISPETRTARVRVVLANGDLRLKPGMYATLVIVGTERGRVLTVPRGAVLSTGERNVVFVRDSANVVTPREVAIGAANDERIEVLRGLREGETVVSSATFLVDAESNLAKALGGMGSMPGMDMQTPPAPLPMQETRAGTSASPAAKRPASPAATKDSTDHSGHGGHPEP